MQKWKHNALILKLSWQIQTSESFNDVFIPDSFISTYDLWIFTTNTWEQREHFAVYKNFFVHRARSSPSHTTLNPTLKPKCYHKEKLILILSTVDLHSKNYYMIPCFDFDKIVRKNKTSYSYTYIKHHCKLCDLIFKAFKTIWNQVTMQLH